MQFIIEIIYHNAARSQLTLSRFQTSSRAHAFENSPRFFRFSISHAGDAIYSRVSFRNSLGGGEGGGGKCNDSRK